MTGISSWTSQELKAKAVDVSEAFDHSDILLRDAEDTAEVNLCLLIPEQCVAWLIGKAGVNINEIKGITGASISFAKKETSVRGLRRCVVYGSVASVARAVLVICSLLQQHQGSCSIGVVVNKNAAGAVIGKGGGNLKLLREQTGCRLGMEKQEESLPALGGRCLTLSHPESALAVTQAVYNIIRLKGFASPSAREILSAEGPGSDYMMYGMPVDLMYGLNRPRLPFMRDPNICIIHGKRRGKANLVMSPVPGAWECKPGDRCKGSGGAVLDGPWANARMICHTHGKVRGKRNLTRHPTLPGVFVCLEDDPCK